MRTDCSLLCFVLDRYGLFFSMMTSSNGNIFRVTDHLCGEFAGHSPHKGQWRGRLMFSLICAWINGWVNNGEPGDLRRHHSPYDVTVMPYLVDSLPWHYGNHIITLSPVKQLRWTWANRSHQLIFPWTRWPPFSRRYFFRWLFVNEKFCILINISLSVHKFVPKFLNDINPASV